MRNLAKRQKERLEKEIQELQDELQELQDKHFEEVGLAKLFLFYGLILTSLCFPRESKRCLTT